VNQVLPHGLQLIGSARYFTSAQAQQQYQQNIYDFSQRQSTLSAALRGRRGRYSYAITFNRTDTYTGLTSATRTGVGPLINFDIADKPIGRTRIYFGVRTTTVYFIRQDNLLDPTTNHNLWRSDVLPAVHMPLGSLSFLQAQVTASWRFTSWSQST